MPRRPPRSIGTTRDIVPAASGVCRGICMDMACPACWGDLFRDPYDHLVDLHALPPLRLLVEMEDATYAALDTAAASLGVPIEEAAAAGVREWAAARKARP